MPHPAATPGALLFQEGPSLPIALERAVERANERVIRRLDVWLARQQRMVDGLLRQGRQPLSRRPSCASVAHSVRGGCAFEPREEQQEPGVSEDLAADSPTKLADDSEQPLELPPRRSTRSSMSSTSMTLGERKTWGYAKSSSYLSALDDVEMNSPPKLEVPNSIAENGEDVHEKRLSRLRDVKSSWQFELFFGSIIILNATLIGVQVDYAASHRGSVPPVVFMILQNCFHLLFAIELGIRMIAEGRLFFSSTLWNILDFFLVAVSVVEFSLSFAQTSTDALVQSSNIRVFRILRISRLAKVVRMVRFMRFVRALRTLVLSIMMTMRSLVWSLVLIGSILFVVGVVFTDAVTSHLDINVGPWDASSPEAVLNQRFGSLPDSMLTLYASVLNGVSWIEIADALAEVSWLMRFLFEIYISFVCLAVLNVVTGVFCQSAIESAQRDHEMLISTMIQDKEFFLKGLKQLFERIDEDGDGYANIKEFESHFDDKAVKDLFEALGLDPADAWSLFSALDQDGDHRINAEEFLDGCLHLRGAASAIDVANLRKDIIKVKGEIFSYHDRGEGDEVES